MNTWCCDQFGINTILTTQQLNRLNDKEEKRVFPNTINTNISFHIEAQDTRSNKSGDLKCTYSRKSSMSSFFFYVQEEHLAFAALPTSTTDGCDFVCRHYHCHIDYIYQQMSIVNICQSMLT